MNIKTSFPRERISPAIFVLMLSLAYFISHLCYLILSGDTVADTAELYQGFIGHEILQGLRMPLLAYQPDSYTGGSVLSGIVTAFFMKLLGGNLLALRLAGLSFAVLSFVFQLKILQENFGAKIAFLAGLLCVFSPPGISSLSIMTLGSHPESVLFSLAALYFLNRILFLNKDRLSSYLMLGLCLGAGFWFAYSNLLSLVVCLPFLFCQGRKKLRLWNLIALTFGFMSGFSPWLVFNAGHQWAGVFFFKHLFVTTPGKFLLDFGYEFINLCRHDFPVSFFFFPAYPFLGHAAGMVCMMTYLYGGVLLWRNRAKDNSFFIYYPFIYLLFYLAVKSTLASHAEITPYRFRYLYPLHIYMMIMAILGLSKARYGKFLYIVLLLIHAASFLSVPVQYSSMKLQELPGLLVEDPSRLMRGTIHDHPSLSLRATANDDLIDWSRFQSFKSAMQEIDKQNSGLRPFLFRSLGYKLLFRRHLSAPLEYLYPDFLNGFNTISQEQQALLLFGMGRFFSEIAASPELLRRQLSELPMELQSGDLGSIYTGMGWELQMRLYPRPPFDDSLLNLKRYTAQEQQWIMEGISQFKLDL